MGVLHICAAEALQGISQDLPLPFQWDLRGFRDREFERKGTLHLSLQSLVFLVTSNLKWTHSPSLTTAAWTHENPSFSWLTLPLRNAAPTLELLLSNRYPYIIMKSAFCSSCKKSSQKPSPTHPPYLLRVPMGWVSEACTEL
jgi:hypothetical protein